MLGVYFPTPNRGGDVGLVYRQCFGPVTNLYFVAKDPTNPDDGWDWLYAQIRQVCRTTRAVGGFVSGAANSWPTPLDADAEFVGADPYWACA